MEKAQLQLELRKLITKSPSLDPKKKEVYLAATVILPQDKLEQLFRIFSQEQIGINKVILSELDGFFPGKFAEVVKEAEKDNQSNDEEKSENLLNNLNK